MNVTVFGPNLRDQSKGSFHVHRMGCADTKRGEYLRGDGPWPMEVTARREVVEDIYPTGEFEWSDGPDDRSYWDDIWFAPCLKDLPREAQP